MNLFTKSLTLSETTRNIERHEILRSTCQRIGRGRQRTPECPRHRGRRIRPLHQEPATMDGQTPDGRRNRRLPPRLRRMRLHRRTDPAPRLLPDQPRTSRCGGVGKVARGLHRRDETLRTPRARPSELPPREPPETDLRGGEPRPHRRIDQPRTRTDPRRSSRTPPDRAPTSDSASNTSAI